MESLIQTFHLDWKLLLVQAVNFAIIFVLIYFFVFKPLVGTMVERNRKIDKGIKDFADISRRIEEAKKEQETIISQAKKDAAACLSEAWKAEDEKKTEMVENARVRIGQVITEERSKMAQEKKKLLFEIKSEISLLVLKAIGRITGEKIENHPDKALIDKTVDRLYRKA